MKSAGSGLNLKYQPLSKTKEALYSRLGNAKVRRKEGLFMAVGAKCVEDTIYAFEPEAIIATPEWLDKKQSATDNDPERWNTDLIRTASARDLERISGMNSAPEVIAVYRIPDPDDGSLRIEETELVLMLDGVQDPGNFGSILRTADWFGIKRIFASRESADLYNPKVIQATMGAVSRVKVTYVELNKVIEANPGVPVYGTLLDGEDIYKAELAQNAFIVMGNEGRGLSEKMRKLVSHKLLIPPYDPVSHGESLNVGAATAITLAAFRNPACQSFNKH